MAGARKPLRPGRGGYEYEQQFKAALDAAWQAALGGGQQLPQSAELPVAELPVAELPQSAVLPQSAELLVAVLPQSAELPVAELPQSDVFPSAVLPQLAELLQLDELPPAVLPSSTAEESTQHNQPLRIDPSPEPLRYKTPASTDRSEMEDLDPTESEPEDCKRPASNTSGSTSSGTVAVQPKAEAKGKATAMCATKAHAKAKKTKASASKEANAKKTKKASASKGCKITCREPPEGMTAMVIKRVTHRISETPVEP